MKKMKVYQLAGLSLALFSMGLFSTPMVYADGNTGVGWSTNNPGCASGGLWNTPGGTLSNNQLLQVSGTNCTAIATSNPVFPGNVAHNATTNGTTPVSQSTLTAIGEYYSALLTGSTATVVGALLTVVTPTSGNLAAVQLSSSTSGLTTIAGVAQNAVSPGSVVNFWAPGSFAICQTTGTVNFGDILVSTSGTTGAVSAAGFLATNNSPTAGTEVATAFSNNNGQQTYCRIR